MVLCLRPPPTPTVMKVASAPPAHSVLRAFLDDPPVRKDVTDAYAYNLYNPQTMFRLLCSGCHNDVWRFIGLAFVKKTDRFGWHSSFFARHKGRTKKKGMVMMSRKAETNNARRKSILGSRGPFPCLTTALPLAQGDSLTRTRRRSALS